MMGYDRFKALKNDQTVTIDLQRFFDTQDKTRSGNLIKHDIGWTIQARKPGAKHEYGFFHVHWAPKEPAATTNRNISAHFKPNHAGPRKNNVGNPADLPYEDSALLYNFFVLLNAAWNDRARELPKGSVVGWTTMTTWITADTVRNFRATNNTAALKGLARNALYDLARWEKDAWNDYMWWMAGA